MTSGNNVVEGSIFVNAPLNQALFKISHNWISSLDKNFINIKLHYSHKKIGINLSSTSSCCTSHKQWSTHKYSEISLFFLNKFHFLLVSGLKTLPQGLENHSKTTNQMHRAKVKNFKVTLSCCGHLALIVSRPLLLVCN